VPVRAGRIVRMSTGWLLTTIEQRLVVRVMGHLSAADVKTLREALGE
jgi:hypothetical protein